MVVFIEDTFDSAHWLPNVPEGHKCRTLHGHTYSIRMEVGGKVDPLSGWILDYAEIKKAWAPIKQDVDHKCINYIDGLSNSTCENLTEYIWDRLKRAGLNIRRIELRETKNAGAVKEA